VIGIYDRAAVLTLLGVASAVLGMWFALSGQVRGALVCLVAAGVCDLFDGPVARRFPRDDAAGRFGIALDSLADAVSFVALPIAVAHALGVRSALAVPFLLGYALAGVVRLAYFTMLATAETTTADASGAAPVGTTGHGPEGHYRGLPVTYAALVFPVAALLSPVLPRGVFVAGYATLVGTVAVLFVLDVPVRKPRRAGYAVFAALAVAVTTALLIVDLP